MKAKTNDAIGKVLTEDILNANGNLVLPRGVTVTSPLAVALLRQGIHSVEVDEQSDDNEQRENGTMEQKLFREHVNFLFIRHRGPFMKEFQTWLLKE